MLISSSKIIQNYYFNSFNFSLVIIFLFLLFKIIASYYYYFEYELNIFNLSNVFGGYIESLYNDQNFKNCNFEGQFTVFKKGTILCSYSTRMPVLPYLYYVFTFISKKYFFIAILKNILISLIFLFCLKIFYKIFILKNPESYYLINFSLLIIFVSPPVIKHASNISYEEGIILELLILWSLFFLQSCYLFSKHLTEKNDLAPIFSTLLSTIIYFTKASMLLCLIISIAISLIWLIKKKNYKIVLVIIVSISLILSWGFRNLKKTNVFNIGSSINWVIGYYGLNNTALKIYPQIALDQIFFADNFKLKNNNIIENKVKIDSKFENEWDNNNYYKNKSLEWVKNNPLNFIKFTFKKFYNFFIYVKKTPYSVGPIVNSEYEKYSFSQIVVFFWLLFGRLSTLLLLYLIYKNWQEEKFLCFSIIVMCAAYAAPYLIGFNYERHITPFIIMTIFSNIVLYNADKDNHAQN
jgi:hypothetical protein